MVAARPDRQWRDDEQAVAAVDLVVALYNPRSKKRVRQLELAVEIFRRHRRLDTLVGVVTSAGREDQTVVLTDLEHLLEQEVGMGTIVIVANSAAKLLDGWLVTSRGYSV